jgi:hypothetical protein
MDRPNLSPQAASSGVPSQAPECAPTPGPWRVSKSKQGVSICGQLIDCFEIEAVRDACWVAQVQNHRFCVQTPEGDANARLIAAAPCLLASLKECVLQIEYLHEKFQATGSGTAAIARAEAAIAKAEGR